MTEQQDSLFARLLGGLTGARSHEVGRVILAFFALHFLLISYYLIKPLRNSQFLKEFNPDFLPVVTFGVVLVSFIATKIFSFLADRVEKYRLVMGAYLLLMVLKLVFGHLLLTGSKTVVVAFYFFGSTYFLLAIATMWACHNDIFTPDQGERCYGFIVVGGSTGGIVGSWISAELTRSPFKDHVPECSALSMGVALILVMLASRKRRQERREAAKTEPPVRATPAFWSDLSQILARPYVRRIGTMVLCLAVFNSCLDYISNRAIDREVTQERFEVHFSYLNAEQYPTVYSLKEKSHQQRQESLAQLAQASGQPVAQLISDYQAYQEGNESRIREVFSDVYSFQGILGIVLLLVVARVVFRHFGVRYATIILPILAGVSVVAFAFPLGLLALQIIMVVVGAANYSLNNAAKELLYTASDEETKFKHKPLIEGPGMRFGDVVTAVILLSILQLGRYLGWSETISFGLIQAVLMVAIVVWTRAAYLAGKEYDLERRVDANQARQQAEHADSAS